MQKTKLKYDRDLLLAVSEMIDELILEVSKNPIDDMYKMLLSTLAEMNIRHKKLLADNFKKEFTINYPANYALALKIFFSLAFQYGLVTENSWVGNEILIMINTIDPKYL